MNARYYPRAKIGRIELTSYGVKLPLTGLVDPV